MKVRSGKEPSRCDCTIPRSKVIGVAELSSVSVRSSGGTHSYETASIFLAKEILALSVWTHVMNRMSNTVLDRDLFSVPGRRGYS